MVMPSGLRSSEPVPVSIASGIAPNSAASVVIMIGRKRSRHASKIASRGDILSDLASELSGSLGLAGSIMASDTLCCAQAQHGSAPTLAGRDVANPTSMILSVAMLVRWVGDQRGAPRLQQAGDAIAAAVDRVLADPATRTRDIGGRIGCATFGQAVAAALAAA